MRLDAGTELTTLHLTTCPTWYSEHGIGPSSNPASSSSSDLVQNQEELISITAAEKVKHLNLALR